MSQRHHRPEVPVDTASPADAARDADSMYWMSRYVERAEHVGAAAADQFQPAHGRRRSGAELQQRQWQSVLTIIRLDALAGASRRLRRSGTRIAAVHDVQPGQSQQPAELPHPRPRKRPRHPREHLRGDVGVPQHAVLVDPRRRRDGAVRGIARRFLPHGHDRLDAVPGPDRSDAAARPAVAVHAARQIPRAHGRDLRGSSRRSSASCAAPTALEAGMRNIHWMAVLRSCCSIEAYRRQHVGDMDPLRVASFLILERNSRGASASAWTMPRSAIGAIRSEVNALAIDPAERILGRLDAQLGIRRDREILSRGRCRRICRRSRSTIMRGGDGGAEVVFLALTGSGRPPCRRKQRRGCSSPSTGLREPECHDASQDHPPNRPHLLRPHQRIGDGTAHGPAAGAGPAPPVVHSRRRPADAARSATSTGSATPCTRSPSTRSTSRSASSPPASSRPTGCAVEPERFLDMWPLPPSDSITRLYDYLQFGGPIVDCARAARARRRSSAQAGNAAGRTGACG